MTRRKIAGKSVKDFFDQSRQDLLTYVERPARASRVFHSIYQNDATRFEDIPAIPGKSREVLSNSLTLALPTVTHRFQSADGTRRCLIRLHDGETIESVMIPRSDRVTFCISSQVGCALGCTFCLTGQLGLTRDLSPGEIVSQVVLLRKETTQRRYSIVFMGMGEPLQNYDNVLKAVSILHDDHGLAVPLSRITVSTAGLLPAMERLADEPLFPNLSISLTGATNAVRDAVMPINRKYPIQALIDYTRRLPAARQARVMFECVMIKGLTDTADQACELARLLRGMRSKVNLIPLNSAPEIPFESSDDEAVFSFQSTLLENGTAAFIRKNRGGDVSSACGQLKGKVLV
jgi:23S rRNA (adenine2503-C2)-methyltransferase